MPAGGSGRVAASLARARAHRLGSSLDARRSPLPCAPLARAIRPVSAATHASSRAAQDGAGLAKGQAWLQLVDWLLLLAQIGALVGVVYVSILHAHQR